MLWHIQMSGANNKYGLSYTRNTVPLEKNKHDHVWNVFHLDEHLVMGGKVSWHLLHGGWNAMEHCRIWWLLYVDKLTIKPGSKTPKKSIVTKLEWINHKPIGGNFLLADPWVGSRENCLIGANLSSNIKTWPPCKVTQLIHLKRLPLDQFRVFEANIVSNHLNKTTHFILYQM